MLEVLLALPFVLALSVAVLRTVPRSVTAWVAAAAPLLGLAILAWYTPAVMDGAVPRTVYEWIPQFGLMFDLRLDGLAWMFAGLVLGIAGGQPVRLEAALVVPGDVMLLEAGDQVPADGRLLECAGLQADESAMTGESLGVEKALSDSLDPDTSPADQINMVMAGTVITAGRGRAVVVATGMDTRMGRIAGLLLDAREVKTPLQKRMGEISKTLSFLCLCLCAVMFGVGLLQGRPMLDMFLTAVSLAVAAIPEGLSAIVTIVLAMGVQRMAKRGAIVKSCPRWRHWAARG